jgi:hypothetical protein
VLQNTTGAKDIVVSIIFELAAKTQRKLENEERRDVHSKGGDFGESSEKESSEKEISPIGRDFDERCK